MAREFNSINVIESFAFSRGILNKLYLLTLKRKAKDYTYLYGNSLDDTESSLTRHLTNAFVDGSLEWCP